MIIVARLNAPKGPDDSWAHSAIKVTIVKVCEQTAESTPGPVTLCGPPGEQTDGKSDEVTKDIIKSTHLKYHFCFVSVIFHVLGKFTQFAHFGLNNKSTICRFTVLYLTPPTFRPKEATIKMAPPRFIKSDIVS